MNDLRNGQHIYIRAKVVSTPAEQWSEHRELAVVFTDSKGNPVSGIQHFIAVDDRPALMTLPEAIRAVERMGQ